MKKRKPIIYWLTILFLANFSACCTPEKEIVGSWIQPIPGQPGRFQGIIFQSGGQAASLNMVTLQYESWRIHEGRLVLTGKSIGNRQTLSFADTLDIVRLSADTLVLKRGKELELVFTRKKEN